MAYVLSSRLSIVILIMSFLTMPIISAEEMDTNETDAVPGHVLKEIEGDVQAVGENLSLEEVEVIDEIGTYEEIEVVDEIEKVGKIEATDEIEEIGEVAPEEAFSQHFEDYTAEDLIGLMSKAMDEVDTARTVTATTMNVSMVGSSGLFSLPLMFIYVDIYSEGAFNFTSSAGSMYMATTMGLEDLGDLLLMEVGLKVVGDLGYMNASITTDSETEVTEMYVLEDSIYINVNDIWEILDISDAGNFSELEDLQYMQDGLNMLTKPSQDDYLDIELVESEMIDGDDCYKIRMVPNTTDDILDLLDEQIGYTLEDGNDLDLSETYDDVDINMEFEEILWISKETHLLKKKSTTGYIFESASFEDNTNVMLYLGLDSTAYHEYNLPVNVEEIEVPDFLKVMTSLQKSLRNVTSTEVSKPKGDASSSKLRPVQLGSFRASMKTLSGVELSRQISG